MPVNGKPNGRFELPALTPITFSLTEGTDIPPPVDSPVEEKASAPAPTNATSAQTASDSATNGHNETSNGAYDGRGRSSGVDAPPLSPTSTTKPSSIRRLFSRKSLNQNYTHSTNNNGSDEHLDAAKIQRPESSMSFLDRPGQAEKKRGSWFKRLGSANGSKRSSVIFEPKPVQQAPAPVKKGPPPPKLPELNRLKAKVDNDVGSLGGGDMFKNIK